MGRRASALIKVAALKKDGVTAAEAVPAAGSFVNLRETGITWSNGIATPIFAVMPDQDDYERLTFRFGVPTLGAADNEATLSLLQRQPDGSNVEVGQSKLDANDRFPAIEEIENAPGARYFVQVLALTGAAAKSVTVDVFVQGINTPVFGEVQ